MNGEAARLRAIANRKLLRGKLPAEWSKVDMPWPDGSAVAQRDALADAIEEYLLWQPGKFGHATAHKALVDALRKVRLA